jgi:GT2 family glycosyltransferase
LRNTENKGFTGGNNRGIVYAIDQHYDYLMLLNNDTEVEPNFLDELVRVIHTDSNIGAVQPKFFFLNNKERIWNAGGTIIKSLGWVRTVGENRTAKEKYDLPKNTEWITGCCFMVRTEIVKKIGGLNDRFFIYYEDVEWSLRIQSLGYKLVYCPQSVVYHEAGMSNKKKEKGKEGYLNPIVHFLATRNNILMLRKYTPWYFVGPVIAFQSIKYTGILSYFLVRRRFEKIKFVCNGLKEGIFSKGI